MPAPQTPRAPKAPPSSQRDPALPPLPFQISLRLLAAAVHVIFVAVAMQDYWGGYWWNADFSTLGPWLAALMGAAWDYLRFFADGLRALAPWALAELVTVALVFGVRFHLLMRLCAAAGLGVFAVQALKGYVPGRFSLLLFVITECITVVLVLIARPAGRADWRPVTAFFTMAATFYFFALSFAPPELRLIPDGAGVFVEGTGVAWTIFAKLSLGRSFGLLPADRGIVTRGAYRWVRHPVYLGYFISNVGFLLANFCWRNLAVFSLLYSFQAIRVIREEKLLRANPEYQAYCQKVRWRFVPFVF